MNLGNGALIGQAVPSRQVLAVFGQSLLEE